MCLSGREEIKQRGPVILFQYDPDKPLRAPRFIALNIKLTSIPFLSFIRRMTDDHVFRKPVTPKPQLDSLTLLKNEPFRQGFHVASWVET